MEVLRGNLSQLEFATTLGVDRKTIGTWERGERLPDTRALLGLWGQFDADPAWVLTGRGFEPVSTADERELLALYRAAPLAVKMAAVGALQGAASAPSAPQTVNQTNRGGSGQVQIGYVAGAVHTTPVKVKKSPGRG